MDLLYSKYADPMSLMDIYIKQGRFGEFVYNMFEIEHKRKEAEAKKEAEAEIDRRYWELYLRTPTDKSFIDWKDEAMAKAKDNAKSKTVGSDKNMTDSDIENIITELFPTINKEKNKDNTE